MAACVRKGAACAGGVLSVSALLLMAGCEHQQPAMQIHESPPADTVSDFMKELDARVTAQADSLMLVYPADRLASLPDSTFRRVWAAAREHGSQSDEAQQWREAGRRVDSINARERLVATIVRRAQCDSPSRSRIREHLDKGWFTDVLALIACRQVRIGMSAEQAVASWGRPNDINRTTYSFGVHEQWVYGEYGAGYLYFEDGVLVTIQN